MCTICDTLARRGRVRSESPNTFALFWARCTKNQIHPHFSEPDAQKVKYIHTFLSSLRQNCLLFKSSQFHAQPIAKSGHFEATWGEGRSRGRPERVFTQNTKYDYKGRFQKSGVRAISGFASYSRCKKPAVFEMRRARSAIHSHGEEG